MTFHSNGLTAELKGWIELSKILPLNKVAANYTKQK